MATVTINGQEIEIGDDERLNGIQAAARVGEDVPHYCWHPGLSVVASCRMCLVETGRKDKETGEVSMMPKLVPGCQTPATDGTVFVTNSDKVKEARAMVEEDLLIRHPIDCPICDKAGECLLQDYHFEHGQGERRADIKPFTSRRRTMGDTVELFVDRCVMCTRCVRFTREITGTAELMVVNRGAHEEIDVFPGFPLDNKMSGNVVDLCPVGALGDTDFLYSQRVWFMNKRDHVCAGCSTGCSITVEENQDTVYRLKPRENEHVNKWWMCDEGRYGFKHVHDENRVTQLRRKQNDGHENMEWSELPQALSEDLKDASLTVVLSPHLTVEEAYLLATYAKQIDEQATFLLGHVPEVGEDESFQGGFTIRKEKCPNRRGVEAIVSHFGGGQVVGIDDYLTSIEKTPDAIWFTGGYKTDWNDEKTVAAVSGIRSVIVQDCFKSPLWDAATHQLPAATFAERGGSYVNFADRLQSFDWAVRVPAGATVEGHLYWRLLGRKGMYKTATVLDEVAKEIPFYGQATGEIPATGVDLRVNQLA